MSVGDVHMVTAGSDKIESEKGKGGRMRLQQAMVVKLRSHAPQS